MGNVAISISNLSKQYQYGGNRAPYRTFRDAIAATVSAPLRRLRRQGPAPGKEYFYALKNVSFDVEQGDVVGIIGRNGAGKSTLLKILSRITEPSAGQAGIYGKMGSLLEVGTGFHPELTGRENIYLSGSILGMRKSEIDAKFDEIVRFAATEKFLDTPLKHYSSGMQVRLGFAVAAHLDTEILTVDEVLAVGDLAFQKKCLGKMSNIANEGRTVLFVSHQMNAVEKLCKRAILLDGGEVIADSRDVRSIIKGYEHAGDDASLMAEWVNSGARLDNPWFRPTRFYAGDEHGRKLETSVPNSSGIWVYIEGIVDKLDSALELGYNIYTEDGFLLYISYQTDQKEELWPEMEPGKCVLRSKIPENLLNEGTYRLELSGSIYCRQWLFQPGVSSPTIFLSISSNVSNSPYWQSKRPVPLAPVISWERYDV
jgi:lipopolysaccharide transport system ATP-binding protein